MIRRALCRILGHRADARIWGFTVCNRCHAIEEFGEWS
jgi:hypothetical protein